jgi:DNA-3-methyladenine glycosylase II
VLLSVPEPYDFEQSTARFRAFGPDLANVWHDGALLRVVEGVEVRIAPTRGGVLVDPWTARIEAVVGKLLGLEFDLPAFYGAVDSNDSVLAGLISRLAGLRPSLAPDPFESLVTSITAQQVSLRAAFAIRSRLIARFGRRADRAYAFPTRERIARASPDELVGVGFSRRKADYVVGLAREELDYDELATLDDEGVKERLMEIRGVGEWTADWYLARHLARPRAWPAGDLGLRRAVSAFYGDGVELTSEEVRTIGSRFAPYQNLTAHYLLVAWMQAD